MSKWGPEFGYSTEKRKKAEQFKQLAGFEPTTPWLWAMCLTAMQQPLKLS